MEGGGSSISAAKAEASTAVKSQAANASTASSTAGPASKKRARRPAGDDDGDGSRGAGGRRCISTACIACRKRKSKCDGALPSCAACASVYGTECIYNPNSDHRRKGVYREKADPSKAQNSTLKIIVEAILSASEEDLPHVVNMIRTCESLDGVAQDLTKETPWIKTEESEELYEEEMSFLPVDGERDLAGKMGELRLENGSVRFFGGTSHLVYLGDPQPGELEQNYQLQGGDALHGNPILSWTRATSDLHLVVHLMNMYFNYHYPFFTTLSRNLFWTDFLKGKNFQDPGASYCSSLLVNAMLALGCHFTDTGGAYGTPGDNRTKGDQFFAEAKRLIFENDELERPRLVTVQALALMSVREAGCGREAKGWVYSGMSFRMALDMGLNFELSGVDKERMTDEEIDARRITFWGCFLFDKCWSNYLGRLPQLPTASFNVSRFEVFPDEDAATWMPLTDKGYDESHSQPSRTRAVALQLSALCEISSDILLFFYHPSHLRKPVNKAVELKRLGELHQRLEAWQKGLPKELEPKEGQLPNVILMHTFFHLQYIHLFRPFLKYAPSASPLPSHISPRRICSTHAGFISKHMRLYKKSWNMRQICNIAVYIIHNACTIHLLNLPDKGARRDITHGLKHLEEIAEDWLGARRTLSIISVLARKWNCELPEEAAQVLKRTDEKYDYYNVSEVPSPRSSPMVASPMGSEESGPANPRQEYTAPMQPMTAAVLQHTIPVSIGERMSMGPSVPIVTTGISQNQPIGSMDPMHMSFNVDMLGRWPRRQSLSAGAESPPSTSTNPSILTPDPLSQSMMGEIHAPPSHAMGGHHWILSDSARLHQNFGSWQHDGGLFMFRGNQDGGYDMTPDPSDMNAFVEFAAESLSSLNPSPWVAAQPGLE